MFVTHARNTYIRFIITSLHYFVRQQNTFICLNFTINIQFIICYRNGKSLPRRSARSSIEGNRYPSTFPQTLSSLSLSLAFSVCSHSRIGRKTTSHTVGATKSKHGSAKKRCKCQREHALSRYTKRYINLTTFMKYVIVGSMHRDRSIARTEIRSARNRPGNWMTLRNAPMSNGFFSWKNKMKAALLLMTWECTRENLRKQSREKLRYFYM